MKKLLTLLFSLAFALGLSAATYRIDEVPNVHLADSTRFVTNPDGILSAEGQARIDSLLHRLSMHTTAEVVAVVVDDIDPDMDIDDFATDLFRAWGLGKKDTNNGALLLVVKDRQQYVFRTGSGLEGLLPDGLIGQLLRREMRPRFRHDDFDGGIFSALDRISTLISTPEAIDEIRSKYLNNEGAEGDGPDLFRWYLVACAIMSAAMLAWLIATWARTRGKSRYDRYLAADRLYAPTLLLTFAGLGGPLVALIPLLLWRHSLRRGARYCPDCHTRMRLIDEVHDNDYLTHAQDVEEKIGAVDYDVWLCPKCGETEIIPYIIRSAGYQECPVCHARTFRVVSDRVAIQPTQHREGLRVVTRRCANCGHQDDESHRMQKLASAAPIIIGGLGGGSGSSGGGFGGGSFGGGFTAGGGAGGSW